MPTPSIIILGVYKPDISSEVYQEQWQVTDSDEESNAHFEDLVLIEAVVDEIDDRFKLIEIGQPQALQDYPNHFQCAYDEALLSADGKQVIERRIDCVKGKCPLRFAFYLHCYDANRALQWSYGKVECPRVEPAPKRLKYLVPYRACT